MNRIIIAGCRDFHNYEFVEKHVNEILKTLSESRVILSGGTNGVDALGEEYAEEYKIPLERYEDNLNIYGKSAELIRNNKMVQNADTLIAFWDFKSKGTKNMIDTATEHGLNVHIIQIP